MFFTPELLSKRDSGFGLLWLAATLGSRSSFKKLPKRSVLTADITQLCDLISEPTEPLALRLSSNLMFGVVRVYKVKQEMLMTDVTNCVATLKKVVQDLRISGTVDIQMANPTAKASTLTIVPDPREAYAFDYDAFVVNWGEYLDIEGPTRQELVSDDDDPDFGSGEKKKKRNAKAARKPAPLTEVVRKEAHTLDEHHEHLLSASFDLSSSNNPGHGISSSQADVGFDENPFAFSDGLDIGIGGGLGDDLARELGWATSPVKSVRSNRTRNGVANEVDQPDLQFNDAGDFNIGMDFDLNIADMAMFADNPAQAVASERGGTPAPLDKAPKFKTPSRKENPPRMGSLLRKMPAASPATSFSRLLLSQDDFQPLKDITDQEAKRQNKQDPRQKIKSTRLLLDARTELTDDELKIARAKYVETQNRLKREMARKRYAKDSDRLIEELIWSVPKGIQEEGLRNFWQENFKVQVEARTGALRIHQEDNAGPPMKRRRMETIVEEEPGLVANNDEPQETEWAMNWGAAGNDMDMGMVVEDVGGHRHSSEEPGQARRISRSASGLGAGNLAFDLEPRGSGHGSQRSSLFPWDNAGASSSSVNAHFPAPDVDLVEPVDIRLRSSSISRRDSPFGVKAPSQRGSTHGSGLLVSPGPGGRSSQIFGEDFAFEVEDMAGAGTIPEETQQETQKSELNLIALERNSFNFLEYAKMQYQTLTDGRLAFDTVVPRATSTRHVAAAGFYHCLVLGTKNLIRLEQTDPYGSIFIDIV